MIGRLDFMDKKIADLLQIIRGKLVNNPDSILFADMGKKNSDIQCMNPNISEYYKFLEICDGARFGCVDLWSYKELESAQYRKDNMLPEKEKWLEIGQIIYEPLVVNIENGSMICFSGHYGDENQILHEFKDFNEFLEQYILGDMYKIIGGNCQDDLWYIFLQELKSGSNDIKEQIVSLWIGNFDTEENMKNYFKVSYSEGGYRINSLFENDFTIGKYNEDFSERNFLGEINKPLDELLLGLPYYNQILPKFMEILKDYDGLEGNTIMLLYDFKFHGYKKSEEGEGYKIQFIGAVAYEADVDMEWLENFKD